VARGWVGKQPGWTVWRREKLIDLTGIRNPDRPILAKLNPISISRPCVYICVKIKQKKGKKTRKCDAERCLSRDQGVLA
jgi:hypothetical protein